MTRTRFPSGWEDSLIVAGAVLFLAALAGSAFFEPKLRILHALQALIYVAILFFAPRSKPWAFGAGAIMALAWNAMNLFGTHLMQKGTAMLLEFLRTGHASQPVTMMVAVGGFAHVLLFIGCGAGFLRLRPGFKQWAQFLGGGVAAVAWLALAAALTIRHGM